MKPMHIELSAPSLAECYAKFMSLDYVKVTDLCHAAKVVIDIDLDSPFDGSYYKSELKLRRKANENKRQKSNNHLHREAACDARNGL